MNEGEGIASVARDARWVVVVKPAGMPSVPGRDPALPASLAERVAQQVPGARIVHRLDMDTSGLMVLALDAQAHRALSAAFAARRVAKRYVAIVHGLVADAQGWIDAPLRCDWPHRPRQIVDAVDGKPARTRWRVIGRDAAARTSRLELEPETGRSHQLRVHLVSIGHPIVGDRLYGLADADAALGAVRLHLHAEALSWPPLSWPTRAPRRPCGIGGCSAPTFESIAAGEAVCTAPF